MEPKFITVDTHTKVAYGLYNWFVPLMLFTVILSNIIESPKGAFAFIILCLPITLLLSIGLLCGGLLTYGRFVQIDDEYISVCKKSFGGIKILNRINRNDIKEITKSTYHHIILVTKDDKKIKLLTTAPSLLLVVLTVPFLSIPFVLRKHALRTIKLNEINEALDIKDVNIEGNANQQKKSMRVIDIFMWLVIILAIVLSLFGFLLGLYAFLAVAAG